MDSKKIIKLLLSVAFVLAAAFFSCLGYSLYDSAFSFVDTISAISSFFVACLTVIYVYTSSKQMDIMKQQLDQMRQEQQLREQPVLDVKSIRFDIERPKFYYLPPQDKYLYLARYFLFVQIHNLSSYPAAFVDIDAHLIIEENGHQLQLGAAQKRINIVAANTQSDDVSIMFAGDSPTKIITALRGMTTADLPKLELSICYKSLSGANYLLNHTYILDVPDKDESIEILRNWHTTLAAAPIEEKETINLLKRAPKGKEWHRVFDLSKELFDKKLMGGKVLPLSIIEIVQKFSLKTISDVEYNQKIQNNQYGHYIGNHFCGCPAEKEAEDNLATLATTS